MVLIFPLEAGSLRRVQSSKSIERAQSNVATGLLRVSALRGDGLSALRSCEV